METMGGVFIYNDKRYEKEVSKWQRIKPNSLLTRNSPKFQTLEYRSKSNWMLMPLCWDVLPEM